MNLLMRPACPWESYARFCGKILRRVESWLIHHADFRIKE